MDGSAIFGFAGVLVGAGGAYVSQRGVESRRDRAEARVGIRLVEKDALLAVGQVNAAVQTRTWWTLLDDELSLPNWRRYEAVLAGALQLEDWLKLLGAFQATELLDLVAKLGLKSHENHEMGEKEIAAAVSAATGLEEAIYLLGKLSRERLTWREKLHATRQPPWRANSSE